MHNGAVSYWWQARGVPPRRPSLPGGAEADVCIVGARRTPIGRFLGSLSRRTSVDLAVHAAEAALGPVPKSLVDQVIVGFAINFFSLQSSIKFLGIFEF